MPLVPLGGHVLRCGLCLLKSNHSPDSCRVRTRQICENIAVKQTCEDLDILSQLQETEKGREAWCASAFGVTESRTRLSD